MWETIFTNSRCHTETSHVASSGGAGAAAVAAGVSHYASRSCARWPTLSLADWFLAALWQAQRLGLDFYFHSLRSCASQRQHSPPPTHNGWMVVKGHLRCVEKRDKRRLQHLPNDGDSMLIINCFNFKQHMSIKNAGITTNEPDFIPHPCRE